MSHDTRTHFDLTDATDRDQRHNGVPHQHHDDDVVDGELVDPADGPEHLHDQDGVAPADRAGDTRDDEPVDLDGFGGTTRGGHDVAVPDTDATDDPVHPEARIGDETPAADDPQARDDEDDDELRARAGGDAQDEQARTLDDLADVEVSDYAPADRAAADDEPADEERDAVGAAAVAPDPPAGGPDAVDEPVRPDVDAAAAASLWAAGAADDLRQRWQAAQLRFVDDPAAVAAEMRDLVAETVDRLQQSAAQRRQELDEAFGSAGTDTEQLRQAVQRYRDFHEQLLGR